MKNILIIESDEEYRLQLEEELKKTSDYNFVLAADGVTAYQKCRNQEFAVVFMSYDTKKLAGLKLIEAIRENNLNAFVHIIVHIEDIQKAKVECQDFRNMEYIQKPADYDDISDKISRLANTDPQKKHFKLDVDFINPFIDSAVETLNQMCGVNSINAETPYLYDKEEHDIDIQISGTIKVSSPFFKGAIAISFKQEVYDRILQQMLDLKENQKLENDDGAAEILNVIHDELKLKLMNMAINLKEGYLKY
jgi:DNA-binding NarL/FixJ family response regulator